MQACLAFAQFEPISIEPGSFSGWIIPHRLTDTHLQLRPVICLLCLDPTSQQGPRSKAALSALGSKVYKAYAKSQYATGLVHFEVSVAPTFVLLTGSAGVSCSCKGRVQDNVCAPTEVFLCATELR